VRIDPAHGLSDPVALILSLWLITEFLTALRLVAVQSRPVPPAAVKPSTQVDSQGKKKRKKKSRDRILGCSILASQRRTYRKVCFLC